MELYRIQTGRIKVKSKQICRSKGVLPKLGKIFCSQEWSDWLPIYCWIIDHPEGIILVDTGETYRTNNDGYLPRWNPYFKFGVQFDVREEDEVGYQLSNLGINPFKDVSKVILTHLHTDHAGGLYHFPASEIIIHRKEFDLATGRSGASMAGYLPHRWPSWLNPTFIEFGRSVHGPFNESLSVTKDRKVVIVSTPGHTAGHISVIVEKEGYNYFLAGDASYNQENMLKTSPDGLGDKSQSINTLKKIELFSRFNPTIYLPSHDPDVPNRMDNKIMVGHYLPQHVETSSIY
jgi:glyoxylase-like metal-dependent hydrolase (beta-lactamase superfamily II)